MKYTITTEDAEFEFETDASEELDWDKWIAVSGVDRLTSSKILDIDCAVWTAKESNEDTVIMVDIDLDTEPGLEPAQDD